jgi:hypothetical protein
VARTDDELLELVQGGNEGPASAFRERFCSLEDGHAAERVIEAVFR